LAQEEEQSALRALRELCPFVGPIYSPASQWQRGKDENREIVEGRFCWRNSKGGITAASMTPARTCDVSVGEEQA
jgi:hypothetical protein